MMLLYQALDLETRVCISPTLGAYNLVNHSHSLIDSITINLLVSNYETYLSSQIAEKSKIYLDK
jgi:hypothetical protein